MRMYIQKQYKPNLFTTLFIVSIGFLLCFVLSASINWNTFLDFLLSWILRCWFLSVDLSAVGGPIGSRLPVTCLSCSAMELLCTFCTLCTVQSVQPIYLVFAYRLHSSIQYCFGTLFVSAFDFFNFSIYQHFIEVSSLYS